MPDTPNTQTTRSVIETLGKKDTSKWPDWFHPEAVLNFKYANRGDFPDGVGSLEEIMFHFNFVMEKRGEVEFFNIVVTPSADEDIVFVEFEQKSWVPRTKRFYEQIYISKFFFREGKVIQWDFYHNPQRAEDAFGGAEGVTEDLNHTKAR